MSKRRRLELHERFIDILGTSGLVVSRVYFQPPPSLKLEYPCIVYNRNDFSTLRANDRLYRAMASYSAKLIDTRPDSPFLVMILSLPFCSYDRSYVAEGLNHDVFNIYY